MPVVNRAFAGASRLVYPLHSFVDLDWIPIAYSLTRMWLANYETGHLQQSLYGRKTLHDYACDHCVVSAWTPLAQPAIWTVSSHYQTCSPFCPLFCYSVWLFTFSEKNGITACWRTSYNFLRFAGLGIDIWPTCYSPAISLSAPPENEVYASWHCSSIILVYTFWSYYVFRGKQIMKGYHWSK